MKREEMLELFSDWKEEIEKNKKYLKKYGIYCDVDIKLLKEPFDKGKTAIQRYIWPGGEDVKLPRIIGLFAFADEEIIELKDVVEDQVSELLPE